MSTLQNNEISESFSKNASKCLWTFSVSSRQCFRESIVLGAICGAAQCSVCKLRCAASKSCMHSLQIVDVHLTITLHPPNPSQIAQRNLQIVQLYKMRATVIIQVRAHSG